MTSDTHLHAEFNNPVRWNTEEFDSPGRLICQHDEDAQNRRCDPRERAQRPVAPLSARDFHYRGPKVVHGRKQMAVLVHRRDESGPRLKLT